jgi:AcrR family transcriptional regulator
MAFDWTAFGRAIPGSRSATAADRQLPRGRHDLPRDVVARTQRERLIDAMARTVALKGYANTVLGDVCAAAGVSTRAFYQHFPDKERCFLAAFESGVELMQRAVATAYGQPGRWPERMRRGLATLLDILAAEPSFAALAVVEVMAAGPRALACRRALLASYVQFFAEAPRRAGQPEVSRVAIEALIAGVYGVIFDHVSIGETARLPDRLPDLTFVILAPFLGPRAAAATAGLD